MDSNREKRREAWKGMPRERRSSGQEGKLSYCTNHSKSKPRKRKMQMLERRFCPQSMRCYQNSCREALTGLGQSHVGDQSSNWNVRKVLWCVPTSVCWQKYTTFVFTQKGRMGGCAWPSNRSDLPVCLMLQQEIFS